MSYPSAWKVLEEMVTEFRKRGISIPADVMNALKYAKTLINILKADPTSPELSQKIEELLLKVESYVISEGHKKFGSEYVDGWLKRLDEAVGKPYEEMDEPQKKFVPGLPREHKWIRVKPSADLPVEKIRRLAEEENLPCELQSDGYLLIYGKEASLKEFVKKMAAK